MRNPYTPSLSTPACDPQPLALTDSPISHAAAAHRATPNPKRLSVGRDGRSAVRCSGMFDTSLGKAPSWMTRSYTVAANGLMQFNCQKEEHQVANRHHPYDVSLEDFGFIKLDLIQDFIEDDGVIDEKEHGLLISFEAAVARIHRGRSLERATELLMKQDGNNISRFTRQRFTEAGLHIDPLDAA